MDMLLYKAIKRVIQGGKIDKEAYKEKVAILFVTDQLNAEQYEELMEMLNK